MRGKGGTSGALQVNVVSLNEDNPLLLLLLLSVAIASQVDVAWRGELCAKKRGKPTSSGSPLHNN
jgi:hypothetical protein